MFGDLESKFPVAKTLNRSAFYVGCHQYMNAADVKRLSDAVHAYFKR
jgi:dTDP-4-amino-4,6-dideoxygalactose transaminase